MTFCFGAARQIRTADLILTKDALYLLSYSSTSSPKGGNYFEQAKPGISKASRVFPGAIQTAVRLELLNGDSEGT